MNEVILETIAKSTIGKDLVKYLKEVEIYYADIRNLQDVKAEVRIDALKILRSALLDKLLVFSGELEKPEEDEFT
jgi:hypothetical protein